MNIYIIAEGEITEKKVYQSWIPMWNENLSCVESVDLLSQNNFTIYAGGGYPCTLDMIDAAIEDVNQFGRYCQMLWIGASRAVIPGDAHPLASLRLALLEV
jgi:hypothetical protein